MKTQIHPTLPAEVIAMAERAAKLDNRSMANYLEVLIRRDSSITNGYTLPQVRHIPILAENTKIKNGTANPCQGIAYVDMTTQQRHEFDEWNYQKEDNSDEEEEPLTELDKSRIQEMERMARGSSWSKETI